MSHAFASAARVLARAAASSFVATLFACSGSPFTKPVPAAADYARLGEPAIERACRVYDPATAAEVGLDAMRARCSEADVVFVGEIHSDETTHRLQLWLLMHLAADRGDRVVLAMEQFERDSQPALDSYLAGKTDEATFRAHTRLWKNYDADYRPLVEFAKRHGIPVIASNAATPVRRKLAMEGRKAFEALSNDERGLVAKEMLPHSEAYWKRVADATRGHGALGMGGGDEDPDAKLFSGQSVWDNTMAESIALALERWPDHTVLHVNGGFHSEYFDGTVAQLRKRTPDADIVTVHCAPVDDLALATPPTDAALATFVVHAKNLAQSAVDDVYKVRAERDLEFRFVQPPGVAKPPLLVFLPAEGASSTEAEAWLRARFGREVAIATIDPPLAGIAADLGATGRFFGGADAFAGDLGFATTGTQRAIEYLLRRFELDRDHVVVAGAGDGARVAAALGLDRGAPLSSAIALDPGAPGRLAELDGGAGTTSRKLRVLASAATLEAWSAEAARHAGNGLDCAAVGVTDDPWQRGHQTVALLRDALGLAAVATPSERRHIVLTADTPRARLWAERQAARVAPGAFVAILGASEASARGEDLHASQAIDIAVTPDALRAPHALPLAPGPFGGTTVIVVPADGGDRDSWLALEKDDPINKVSRFHRLRIAFTEGDGDLRAVLTKLKEEGRKNVLVVPAVFCATGDSMVQLQSSITDLAAEFTLAWSPGLGSSLGVP